jgi:hypothetical protein
MVWLWVAIGMVIVFILWAIRRAEGHGGVPPIRVPQQRSGPSSTGKPVGGKRRAQRPRA